MFPPAIESAIQQAIQYQLAGRLRECEQLCRQILVHQPNCAPALHILGALAYQVGKFETAVDLIQQALKVEPARADFLCNLGAAFTALGRLEQSVAALRKGEQINPQMPEIYSNLGHALCELRRFDEAIRASRRAVELRPNYASAYNNLGAACLATQQYSAAIEALQNAIRCEPGFAQAHSNLANLYCRLTRYDEALAACRTAISLNPNLPDTYIVAGNVYRHQGKLQEAIAALQAAVQRSPRLAEAHNALGVALCEAGQIDHGMIEYRTAIQLMPTHAESHNNLGNALVNAGLVDDALETYRASLRIDPQLVGVHSNLVYTLNFSPTQAGLEIIQKELKAWSDRHAVPLQREIQPHTNERNPDRRLRIGYVSPDFYDHCQSFFTVPLLSHHDKSQFEVFCYSFVRKADRITDQIKQFADQWRDISGLSDAQAADLMLADGIDILIDLTQHMSDNRLLIFARKPAPIQIAWLGYPGSNGLETMDYRLSDPYLDPPGMFDQFSVEKTYRLPETFWCYDPLTSEPRVNPLPGKTNGYITFGCLNNFSKVNDAVLARWARTMQAVVGSRLLILSKPGQHRQRTLSAMQKLGIDSSRVAFLDYCARIDYLKLYNRIDISLDTLPYNGHTTSLDSLWMGVPVVSVVGKTPVGRAGLSLLTNVGLPELVAEDEDQFVRIAAELAGDWPRLESIRQSLRQRMEASPLMNAARFAQNFESACRTAWMEWCAGLH